MKTLLEGLLPRFFPGLQFTCIAHEGKQDLERSLPRKFQSWQEPGVRFVIMRDNDNAACRDLKARLSHLCVQGGRSDSLVRIVCPELEAWYLGEPDAIATACDNESLRGLRNKARYRKSEAACLSSTDSSSPLICDAQHLSGGDALDETKQAGRIDVRWPGRAYAVPGR